VSTVLLQLASIVVQEELLAGGLWPAAIMPNTVVSVSSPARVG